MCGPCTSLVLLPGLGADQRLFGPQARAFRGLRIPAWIEPRSGESLAAYSSRMASAFDEPEGPYVLGGASMGGMIALEMAKHLRPRALVLMGSAFSGREVRGWLRLVEAMSRALPAGVIDLGRLVAPFGARVFSSTGPTHRDLFLDMLRDTPTGFIRWASRAVIEWRASEMPACPVHRIHGGRDRIITPPRGGDAVIVERAGHLVSLSHARETNALLERALALVE